MKLSSIAISKLLDIDLDTVIFKITGKKADISLPIDKYRKSVSHIRKTYKNELFELEVIPEFQNPNAVSLQGICILREIITQCNQHPIALMKKVIECRQCVESIKFADKFKYYDMFLSEENQLLIRKKLAECHLYEIGNSKVWKSFMAEIK